MTCTPGHQGGVHTASAQSGSGVLDQPRSTSVSFITPNLRPPSACPRATWRGWEGTYSGSWGACSTCLTVFARKTLVGRERSNIMIHFSSSADPRTGQVHYVAQSFQPTLRLNSISPPSLPISSFPSVLSIGAVSASRLLSATSLLGWTPTGPRAAQAQPWASCCQPGVPGGCHGMLPPHRCPTHTQGWAVGRHLLSGQEHRAVLSHQLCQAHPGRERAGP